MNQRPKVDFVRLMEDEGLPVTEAAIEAELKTAVVAAGSKVSNDSDMSPFWRWVRAAVVTPVHWLVNVLLATHVLPNMFVATASRWALELKAWELNLTPKAAVKAQGEITLTKANPNDATTIAPGAVIQTAPIDGTVYQLRVTAETVIPAGTGSGRVPVEASEAGAAFNLPAGYYNLLPQEIPGIVSAENEPDWLTRLGANEETDEELALRCQNAFTSSGSWHIDDAYRSIIASVAGIRSDNIFFENTGHIQPGTATAYILMEVGPTPAAVISQLNEHIMNQGYHGHGDVLTCTAIPDLPVTITVSALLVKNLTPEQTATTLDEVESRVRAAFRETAAHAEMSRARPQSRFSVSKMASEIHQAMSTVESVKIWVNGLVQEDISAAIEQPRLASLSVEAEGDS
ncbi:baseplate J/gp47 family protein [Photobacterium halotolerans]|uniref:baseplate J/gp47 family protein n=1 Tax=Photobacterium halotolerans TaxID=265726 RepID=UPI00137325A5|nr:baseplate J/gp47 family protein [Photobacterium halotolerans]NAW86322.1 hypothetical protein [Photobacterium halotolerans]